MPWTRDARDRDRRLLHCRRDRRTPCDRRGEEPRAPPGGRRAAPGGPVADRQGSSPGWTDLVEGSIGELSPFHETYSYYAQAVGRTTAVLPDGWEARLVPVPTAAGTGLCLEPHDLVLSKYAAGREKDREYVRAAVPHRLGDRTTLVERLARMSVDQELRSRIARQIDADFAA